MLFVPPTGATGCPLGGQGGTAPRRQSPVAAETLQPGGHLHSGQADGDEGAVGGSGEDQGGGSGAAEAEAGAELLGGDR